MRSRAQFRSHPFHPMLVAFPIGLWVASLAFDVFGIGLRDSGGSLADGTLIGCAVQCPWHGSQFNVTSGHVITGPAERAIPIYGIQIKAGEVFVEPAKSPKKKAA